jgi:hypothetical protein
MLAAVVAGDFGRDEPIIPPMIPPASIPPITKVGWIPLDAAVRLRIAIVPQTAAAPMIVPSSQWLPRAESGTAIR